MFWPRILANIPGAFAVFAWRHEGHAPLLMWQPHIDIMIVSDFMEFQIQLSATTLGTMARQDVVVSLQLLSQECSNCLFSLFFVELELQLLLHGAAILHHHRFLEVNVVRTFFIKLFTVVVVVSSSSSS